MSQQHLKLQKSSQSAAVASDSTKDNPQQSYQDTTSKGLVNHNLQKGKSEVQTFQKKLQRRDLNLIPPSAAIVQSLQGSRDPYASSNDHGSSGMRSGYQLTINSTQNKNKTSTAFDNIDPQQQSRVTTVKHEKGLPNGTIMQCLKQFQRSKQQRQAPSGQQRQPLHQETAAQGTNKAGMSLQLVTPVASQNVANMPISTKSNKSQKSTKARTQAANNAQMAAEAHAQRRQNFTCTTTTKGSLRLTKKSPSNGREQTSGAPAAQLLNQGVRLSQQRDRSSNQKATVSSGSQSYQTHKNARGSTSQQHNPNSTNEKARQSLQKTQKKQQQAGANPDKILHDMDFESKFAMLMRIREERSNESKPELLGDSQKVILLTQSNNPYDPVKLISPNTTTNRQSSQETKLLTLKHFQPAKQISSNVVTPKYLRFKNGGQKQIQIGAAGEGCNSNRDNSNEMKNSKAQSKSQISTHNIATKKSHQVGGTQGTSPENKGPASRIERQHQQTKSLSNNSRQKYSTQQQQHGSNQGASQSKSVKPSTLKSTTQNQLNIKAKGSSGNTTGGGAWQPQPSAPQMRYSVPPDQKSSQAQGSQGATGIQAQAQQQVQGSSSALNGSSELQKRFTRGEIGSHHDASVSSGKANKSFQFGHNTALMSCSSGGDSSNPPQPVRRRSSSGKNGTQQIKISQIQNVNPVAIQPGTSTSASIQNNDNSYINLKKTIPQSTSNNQKNGKRFTFTLNSRDQQKESRPNKHLNSNLSGVKPSTTTTKASAPSTTQSVTTVQAATTQQQQQQQQINTASIRDPSTQKSASKGKSVSAKKGKGQGVQGGQSNPNSTGTTQLQANAISGKNLTFEKVAVRSAATGAAAGLSKNSREQKMKVQTPEEMWYEQPARTTVVKKTKGMTVQTTHSIPTVHHGQFQTETASKRLTNKQHIKPEQRMSPDEASISSVNKHAQKNTSKEVGGGQASGKPRMSKHKKKPSYDQNNISNGNVDTSHMRDSIIDESSVDKSAQQSMILYKDVIMKNSTKDDKVKSGGGESQLANYKRMTEELMAKDNLIQQLYNALGRKDEQLNALTKNCEQLTSTLKARDEKRDRSQQAIKETLKSLEEKLQMFTAQSEHNQGGLRQITQSPPFLDQNRLETKYKKMQLKDDLLLPQGVIIPTEANQTPNLSKQRMDPIKLNFQTSQQQRPTSSTLLQVPQQPGMSNQHKLAQHNNMYDGSNRRPSQISEIDSLVTVAEYMGTQYDGCRGEGQSNYELSATKKETPFAGEGTIGSLASEIQIIHAKKQPDGPDKANYPVFTKKNGAASDGAEELGELTSLSEMEMSNVHDASLDQLERDLVDTQQKLQEQSQKAAAFVKTQQNNFLDLKAKVGQVNAEERQVIVDDTLSDMGSPSQQNFCIREVTEEAEDDFAQLIPKKNDKLKKDLVSGKGSTSKKGGGAREMRGSDAQPQLKRLNNPDMTSQNEGVRLANQHRTEAAMSQNSDGFKSNSLAHTHVSSANHHSYQTKLSKTLSKNKMKLKLAAEFVNMKKEQPSQQTVTNVKDAHKTVSEMMAVQGLNSRVTAGGTIGGPRESASNPKTIKKKIQLPMKIQKGSDSNRLVVQSKSLERGNMSNNSAGGHPDSTGISNHFSTKDNIMS